MQTRLILSTLLRTAVSVLLAGCLLSANPRAGQAAGLTIEVDTTLDSNAAAYQGCTPAPGDCSLRGAISKANADTGNTYTILLQPGETYALTLTGSRETSNATGDLNLRWNMILDGRGAAIDGQGTDRVMGIHQGSITLKNLTLTGGRAPDGVIGNPFGESGGGLYSNTTGTVTLLNCVIENNHAGNGLAGAAGGPGANGENGRSGQAGGGIYVSGAAELVLDGVIVQNNEAGSGGAGGAGGSIVNSQTPGGAGGNGGGGGSSGGVYVSNATLLRMTHSTIRNNRAGSGGNGGPGGKGGGFSSGDGAAGGKGGDGGWGGNGGGVTAGLVHIEQSVFYGNFAGAAGNGGNGGDGGDPGDGVGGPGGNGGAGGTVAGKGGGMEHPYSATAGDQLVTNATFSGNRAGAGGTGGAGGAGGRGRLGTGSPGAAGAASSGGEGGGLYNAGSQGLFLNFVTVTQNAAYRGTGVHNGGSLYARNSIFAANQTFTGAAGTDLTINNAATPFTSDGYNLFGSNVSGRAASDQVVTNPAALGLLPLADNGGPTLSAALTAASPALRFSPCSDRAGQPVTVDQRGFVRPSSGLCDTGAYQYNTRRPVQFLPVVVGE